jgi:hypothetical protein
MEVKQLIDNNYLLYCTNTQLQTTDTTDFQDIVLDSVLLEDLVSKNILQIDANTEFEALEKVKLEVHYSVSTDKTGNNNRADSEVRIMLDTGSGFLALEDTVRVMYNRQVAQGGTTAACTRPIVLETGHKIKLQYRKKSGGGNIVINPNRATLYLKRL